MFEKKFRVRVVHSHKSKVLDANMFCVQYAYYRIIPIWWSISEFVEYGDGLCSIFYQDAAEGLARNLSTIEDVRTFIARQSKKSKNFRDRYIPDPEYLKKEFTDA